MIRCKLVAVFLFFLLTVTSAHSDVIILTTKSQYALGIAETIKSRSKIPTEIKHSLEDLKDSDIVIALGNEALSQAKASNAKNVVGAFVSYFGNTSNNTSAPKLIYSDPSPESLGAFFDKNFNKARIGIIYSQSDSDYINRITSSLKSGDNEVISIVSEGDTFGDLNKLLKMKIDVLFVVNDNQIYKPTNIRFVLDSLFRKRIPVFTSSKALLKAGATASVSPDENQIINETIKAVELLSSGANITTPRRFIETVTVDTNKSMIKLLNVKIREDN